MFTVVPMSETHEDDVKEVGEVFSRTNWNVYQNAFFGSIGKVLKTEDWHSGKRIPMSSILNNSVPSNYLEKVARTRGCRAAPSRHVVFSRPTLLLYFLPHFPCLLVGACTSAKVPHFGLRPIPASQQRSPLFSGRRAPVLLSRVQKDGWNVSMRTFRWWCLPSPAPQMSMKLKMRLARERVLIATLRKTFVDEMTSRCTCRASAEVETDTDSETHFLQQRARLGVMVDHLCNPKQRKQQHHFVGETQDCCTAVPRGSVPFHGVLNGNVSSVNDNGGRRPSRNQAGRLLMHDFLEFSRAEAQWLPRTARAIQGWRNITPSKTDRQSVPAGALGSCGCRFGGKPI